MTDNGNMNAYAGIERISNYTPDALRAYRQGRLDRYRHHVAFIMERADGKPVRIAEVGSGSSALLYALLRAGILREAFGVEYSESRHEFAERWKTDEGYSAVRNVRANFIDVDFGVARWDWFVVIDNTFTYLYPEDTTYPSRLLRAAATSIVPGGRVVLDFINYANRSPSVDYKQWIAFPPTDPFAYGLYSNRVAGDVNDSLSIFIKRDGGEDRKVEKSKVYSLVDITALCGECSLVVDEVFADFQRTPYEETRSERLVVVARKGT